MKLFKSLLVAPATLGLLAPMSVTANELNLTEVSGYSSSEEVQNISEFYPEQLAVTNSRVDGLEARINNFEAGSFSETTTASFSVDMVLGVLDGGTLATDDPVMSSYTFNIGLNTSFTGEDSLDVTLDAGNNSAANTGTAEAGGDATGDELDVDGVAYSFPLAGWTVMVGDNTDGSALFTTQCVYPTPSDTLDECGSNNADFGNGGQMIGASYAFDSGWAVAVGYAGDETALMAEEGRDAYGINGSYTGDNFGISASYAVIEDANAGVVNVQSFEDTYIAVNGYYDPSTEYFPSISVGLETGHDDSQATDEGITSLFVGLSWDDVGPGTFGIGMGHNDTVEGTTEEYFYEVFYAYPVNDGMTVTGLIFAEENSAAGVDDESGVLVKTSFAF